MQKIENIISEFKNLIDSSKGSASFSNIQPITDSNDQSLVFANNETFLKEALVSPAAVIITKPKFSELCEATNKSFIYSNLPDYLVSLILQKYFYTKTNLWKFEEGIDQSVQIDDSCQIASSAFIGRNSIIGKNVQIGNDVFIGSNVVIKDSVKIAKSSVIHDQSWIGPNTSIGESCVIRSATSIGVDSFDAQLRSIPSNGEVLIGNNFECGSQVCIDRPIDGATKIGSGVKIDNLVKIAESCEIGDNSLITAGVQIGSKVKIGKYFMIGGNSYVESSTVITDAVMCGGMTFVDKDISKSGAYGGNPVQPMKEYLRTLASLAQLPKLRKLLKSQQ